MTKSSKTTTKATRKPKSTKGASLEPVRARDVQPGDVLEHYGKVKVVRESARPTKLLRILVDTGAVIPVHPARWLARRK